MANKKNAPASNESDKPSLEERISKLEKLVARILDFLPVNARS